MQGIDQGLVQLQQRLTAGAHHHRFAAGTAGPLRGHRHRQGFSSVELAAAGPIGADEVGIAELADRACPIALAPGPEVAAGKAAEHRRPSGARALAL